MKRFLVIVNFLTVCNFYSFCLENYPVGARSLALAHASISFSDVWSNFNNQAGIATLNNFSAGFFYESKFLVDELSLAAGTFVFPTLTGNFGFSFIQFGKGVFKENKFGLAFSKQLSENFKAGIQIDYLSQLFPENQRSKGLVTFEGGIIFSPIKDLFLGAHVFNPFSQEIKTVFGEHKVSSVFRLGGHYLFDKMVLIALEAEKNMNSQLLLKTGIEFLPAKNLALRFGVSGKPFKYSAGIGYSVGKITTDIGFGFHEYLGVSPSVSIHFNL